MRLIVLMSRRSRILAVCFGLVLIMAVGRSTQEAAAQDVQITDVTSGDRNVLLSWSRAAGDTLTPAERTAVPELTFAVPNGLGIETVGWGNGDLLVGRGAGGLSRRDFLINVGNSEDFYKAGEEPSSPAAGPFEVTGAFQFGGDYVAVAYSERVDSTQAVAGINYEFNPDITIQSPGTLQDNAKTVIFESTTPLRASTPYTVTVSGVSSETGDPLPTGGPFNFTTVAGPVVNIADIQNDIDTYRNQMVTVIGQVYIPISSKGAFNNGYIQDGSGRGINLFGGPPRGEVDDRGNVVEVTGTVIDSILVVALTNYTPVVLASGQPLLGARVLPLRSSLSSDWEGTYIETQGRMSRIDPQTDPNDTRFTVTTTDTTFAGYRIWRSPAVNPSFSLLRSYSLLDSTWTFTDTLAARIFSDPDSIILRGTERDRDPPEEIDGPFNGFGYLYSVTWFEAVLDNTVFPSRTFVFEMTTPEQGVLDENVFPSKRAQAVVPLLANVKVVPNPYNPVADFQRGAFPGPPRLQFVNLPSAATVEIYTAAGDRVRMLLKEEDQSTDFLDWDLKNDNGEDVAPGIYLFIAKTQEESRTGRFVIVR
jgi:hypothetical protein